MLGIACTLLFACLAQEPGKPGVDLIPERLADQWTGDASIWSVEDGELVGRSAEAQTRSHYLYWNGQAGDFELRFDYRIDGGNSGVQYRSNELENGTPYGYQADIEDGPNHTGILYESSGRGIAATRGSRVWFHADGSRQTGATLGTAADLQASVNGADWNSYRVVAVGNRLVHEINGVRMIDVIDDDSKFSRARGTFAVQLHAGPAMEVRYRNMRLTSLEGQKADDHVGAWLPAPDAGKLPEWIWSSKDQVEGESRWFLLPFELTEPAEVVGGLFSGDNHHRVFVDGRPHGAGDDWARPQPIPGGMRLEPGLHGIAVEAINDGGPAGIIGRIDLALDGGERRSLVTNEEWMVWSEAPADWPTPTLNVASTATAAKVISWGTSAAHTGPWNDVLAPKVAPAAEGIQVANGFVVERLYSAQHGEGSWVSMTFGPKGLIYVSPQSGPLMTLDVSTLLRGPARRASAGAAPGVHVAGLQPPRPLPFPVHSAQGLLWANDSLYVNVTAPADRDGGLHRIQDSDGDGRLDKHEYLTRMGPPTEHGVHGIRLGPDGALYVINGNYVKPPTDLDGNSVLVDDPITRAEEDVLLERYWDPRGHAHGILAPAGVLYRTNADGSEWQRIAVGMRNCYDFAISASGEIFTYDADMEWDLGMPWYRSPRVLHLVPGGEYGWRSGSAKWPQEYPDSLPPILETDLSSPVGVELGEGSRFPAKYQQALFLGDWAWGRITIAQLSPDGASYSGTYEDFLQGRGVAVTDLEFGPDGNLWFIIGGRGAQSGLYRVRPLDPNLAPSRLADPPLLAQRHALEGVTGTGPEVQEALTSDDAMLRYLGRLAVERAGVQAGQDLAFSRDTLGLGVSQLSLAAAFSAIRAGDGSVSDEIVSLLNLASPPQGEITERDWLAVRGAMLLPEGIQGLDRFYQSHAEAFPTGNEVYDRELARLLVARGGLGPEMLFPYLSWGQSQETRIHYAMLLAECAGKMDLAQAMAFFMWEHQAKKLQGGLSVGGFIEAIAKRASENMPPEVLAAAKDGLAAMAMDDEPQVAPVGREFVRDWSLDELSAALNGKSGDATRGEEVFGQALCMQCHRVAGLGGSLGPDLTAASRRFSQRDLLEAIIDPMKNRSDQYGNLVMPPGLLNTFSAEEVADLMAYLEAAR